MSTPFYDLASLVVVPSGYKASKVYAQKPLTTDGQITFSRASTATRVNASGLIETVASNVPRLDYLGSTCPKLQLEPQRTNLSLFSIDFGSWAANNSTVTVNTATSPDGTANADLIARSGSGSLSGSVEYGGMPTTSTARVLSVFAKAGTHNFIQLFHSGDAQGYVNFNISTGVVGTSGSKSSGKIENYGNGWFRCSAIYDSTNAFGSSIFIGFANSASAGFAGGSVPDTANIYLYGSQYEEGAYPTSLIPTTSAAVTRLADAASKTGISSLIGQTEGTIFFDVTLDSRASSTWFAVAPNLGAGDKYIAIQIGSSVIQAEVADTTLQAAISFSNSSTGRFKAALAYKANDFVFYVNGTLVGTDTSGTVPTCSQLGLYNYAQTPSVKYNQALLFKTRLSNADLAALTA
jgi:hypothetical protein